MLNVVKTAIDKTQNVLEKTSIFNLKELMSLKILSYLFADMKNVIRKEMKKIIFLLPMMLKRFLLKRDLNPIVFRLVYMMLKHIKTGRLF